MFLSQDQDDHSLAKRLQDHIHYIEDDLRELHHEMVALGISEIEQRGLKKLIRKLYITIDWLEGEQKKDSLEQSLNKDDIQQLRNLFWSVQQKLDESTKFQTQTLNRLDSFGQRLEEMQARYHEDQTHMEEKIQDAIDAALRIHSATFLSYMSERLHEFEQRSEACTQNQVQKLVSKHLFDGRRWRCPNPTKLSRQLESQRSLLSELQDLGEESDSTQTNDGLSLSISTTPATEPTIDSSMTDSHQQRSDRMKRHKKYVVSPEHQSKTFTTRDLDRGPMVLPNQSAPIAPDSSSLKRMPQNLSNHSPNDIPQLLSSSALPIATKHLPSSARSGEPLPGSYLRKPFQVRTAVSDSANTDQKGAYASKRPLSNNNNTWSCRAPDVLHQKSQCFSSPGISRARGLVMKGTPDVTKFHNSFSTMKSHTFITTPSAIDEYPQISAETPCQPIYKHQGRQNAIITDHTNRKKIHGVARFALTRPPDIRSE
jgi:hypothetical protein